jgi:hypothetical protein
VTDENDDLQEQLAAARERTRELEEQLAAAQYGTPAGAGGGTPIRNAPRPGSPEAAEALILGRLQEGNGLQDSAGKLAFSRWVGRRLGDAVEAAMTRPSYRSFSRNSVDDSKVRDDRLPRRSR